jgi:DUF917 family protein
MRELNKQEIIDIIYGCTILGTGGGGSLQGGLDIIEEDIESGKKFMLASLDEIPDDAYIASPYELGSIAPLSDEEKKKYEGLPKIEVSKAMLAFQTMEKYYGKEFYGLIATELGAENTADFLHVCAQVGKVIVDGDPAGRSVPELQHSTFFVNDVPSVPIAVATEFGDTAVLTNVANDERAEALIRPMAVASKGLIGVVDHPTTGKVVKKSVIPNSISYSLSVGKALRESLEKNEDPADNIVAAGGGKMLFRGKVSKHSFEDKDGFTFGETEIAGDGDYEGHVYKVWYKNEHIVSYLDGEIDVTVPDLICIIDGEGVPVTNPYYEDGQELVVFALPAPEIWKSKRGLEVFGPRHFGFDVEYKPI